MIKLFFSEKLWMLLSLLFIGAYILLATMGNLDLREGRFALFMDERITFDGVFRILHPTSFVDFVLSIVHGGDHRYGRSLWYSLAFLSFVPERLFGESGLIVADRTWQLLMVISSFALLLFTLLRSWFYRLLLLVSMLTMPFAAYFMSMPKPEPLQLLFISIFLFFYKRNQMSLQGNYWIFLGLAFGTKISSLPLTLVIVSASIVHSKYLDFNSIVANLTSAFVFFLIGLAIAVPILSPHLAICFLAYKIIVFLINRFKIGISSVTTFILVVSLFIANLFLSIVMAFGLNLKIPFVVWLESTFFRTGHGSDSSDITFLTWIKYTLNDWLIIPVPVSILLFVLGMYLLIYSIRRGLTLGFIVFIAGLVLNISIFGAVHRLWGFYLFTGSILMIAGLFSIIESNLEIRENRASIDADLSLKVVVNLFICLLLVAICFWWIPASIRGHISNSNRTSSPSYEINLNSFNNVVRFLSDFSVSKSKRLNVAYDPAVFIPLSTKDFVITEFVGPYTEWKTDVDVIVLGTGRIKNREAPRSSPAYRDFILEFDGYMKHVDNESGNCNSLPCYVRQHTLLNGVQILVAKRLVAE